MDWLADKVYSVRETAVSTVKLLFEILGSTWAEKNILAKVLSF